jgi:hypothetical protein
VRGSEPREEKAMTERTTIIVLLVALAGGAGAAVLVWRRARERRAPVIVEQPTPTVTYEAEARREFAHLADKFSGLYETLHAACVAGPDPEECRIVLSEWEIRLVNTGSEVLQRTWEALLREVTGLAKFSNGEADDDEAVILLGTRWMELLYGWGVRRDERTTFTLDEVEKRRYRVSGTSSVGEQVDVELPCWTHEGEVIERGIARAVATPS